MISSIIVILVAAFISYVFANYVCVPLIKLSLFLIKTIKTYNKYLTLPSGHKWDRTSLYSYEYGKILTCTKCDYSIVENIGGSLFQKSGTLCRKLSHKYTWVSSDSYNHIHPTCSGYLMNGVLE